MIGLATLDGDTPDLRSVMLREVDAPARTLMFFTDARSSKVAQIAAQPQATLLAWSSALGWQLRLRVRLDVQTSGLAVSSRWARLKLSPAAQDYLSPLPPGAPLDGRAAARPPRPRQPRPLCGGHGPGAGHGLAGTAAQRPPPGAALTPTATASGSRHSGVHCRCGAPQARVNAALRLFKKASMPSCWSAVPNSAWNSRRSTRMPSFKPPS